jgi:hypothetical protein
MDPEHYHKHPLFYERLPALEDNHVMVAGPDQAGVVGRLLHVLGGEGVQSLQEIIIPQKVESNHMRVYYRLNMELDLQSLFGLLCTAVPPQLLPSTRICAYIRGGRLLVNQD